MSNPLAIMIGSACVSGYTFLIAATVIAYSLQNPGSTYNAQSTSPQSVTFIKSMLGIGSLGVLAGIILELLILLGKI